MKTSLQGIIDIVADEFDVSDVLIKSTLRSNYMAEVRAAISIIAFNQGYSKIDIARALNKHHTSILHHFRLYYDTNCIDHIKPKVNSIKSKLLIK